MSKLTEQLLLVLNKEQEIYDQVILLSNEKQNAIVQNDIKSLKDCWKRKDFFNIISEIRRD